MRNDFSMGNIKPKRPEVAPEIISVRKSSNIDLNSLVSRKRIHTDIVAKVDKLPPLPAVAEKLMEILKDEDVDITGVETLLKQDPTLTARVLRLVNSSFFGLRTKISSISQAVVLLGFNSLNNIVLASSIYKLVKGAFPGYGYKDAGLWHHSVMTATWSEKLAKQLGWSKEDTESVFSSGLLHDIGKIVMATYINDHVADMITSLIESKGDIISAEKNLTGIDHAQIGTHVAKKWNFPDNLLSIINTHHLNDAPDIFIKDTALLKLVDYLINQGHIGMYDNFPINNQLPHYCFEILDIGEDEIGNLQEQVNKGSYDFADAI